MNLYQSETGNASPHWTEDGPCVASDEVPCKDLSRRASLALKKQQTLEITGFASLLLWWLAPVITKRGRNPGISLRNIPS